MTHGVPLSRRFDRFVLTAKVAADRVATCYLAVVATDHPFAGREIVLRVLHDHLAEDTRHVEAFRAEGERGLRRGDRAALQVLEVGECEGLPFWALEREAALARAREPQPPAPFRPIDPWLPDA